MNIVFFGTPRLAQIILEKLIDSPFRPQLVVTAPDSKVGRSLKPQLSPVKQTAAKHHIDVLEPKTLNSHLRTGNETFSILNSQFDLAILVAYGKIIPKDILAIPKYGFINIHPSILPKYRGPSPIQSAILAGEKQTGVTIIKLDEEIDHGPILAQKKINITNHDTHAALVEKLGKLGDELLIETLPEYLDEKLKPKPQNHALATFTKKVTK
ncbi:methionyl-tRNA formyltransferase, partial [Candidatus Curtissbacteria bacterium]|nr:methionyl-tRNA formyltransferase [Candidatus Curtissbacteria bacterium]